MRAPTHVLHNVPDVHVGSGKFQEFLSSNILDIGMIVEVEITIM